VSIKNDGHYFCRAGGNRPDGLNEPVTDDDDETWVLFNAMNGNRAEMSPEAAGIAACLMTYSHHACRTECYAMTVHYYRLRDYALQHPECSAIM
ncbi:antirestriction protein, partial [Escherichia coli]|uniref:antirestriction protein n=1 Tax=Escherichia coli TaxID=562 RepID=UPI0040690A14